MTQIDLSNVSRKTYLCIHLNLPSVADEKCHGMQSFKHVSRNNAYLFAQTNLSLLITKQYKIIYLTFLVFMLKIKYTVLIIPLIKERGWFLTLPSASVLLPRRIFFAFLHLQNSACNFKSTCFYYSMVVMICS